MANWSFVRRGPNTVFTPAPGCASFKKRDERCFRCLNQLHVMFEYTSQLGYSTELSASIAHREFLYTYLMNAPKWAR